MAADSLTQSFEALHAERERTWPPEQLQKNIDQRAALVSAYQASAYIQVGDYLPEFTLRDVEGGAITQRTLPSGAAFIFFRFAGCPACNIALPYYARTLWPDLKAAGLPLIAVSPQVPERLVEIKTRHALPFTVASDTDNRFARALGITFEPLETPAAPPAGWIGELTGTQTWTLPQPTIILADGNGRVRFVDVSPDWLKRTEASPVLEALSAIVKQPTA